MQTYNSNPTAFNMKDYNSSVKFLENHDPKKTIDEIKVCKDCLFFLKKKIEKASGVISNAITSLYGVRLMKTKKKKECNICSIKF